jgi:hypothetical protein
MQSLAVAGDLDVVGDGEPGAGADVHVSPDSWPEDRGFGVGLCREGRSPFRRRDSRLVARPSTAPVSLNRQCLHYSSLITLSTVRNGCYCTKGLQASALEREYQLP